MQRGRAAVRPKIGNETYPESETCPERRPIHLGSQTCPCPCPPSPSTCSLIPPWISSCLVLRTLICSCCHGGSGCGIEISMVSDVPCDLHGSLISTLSVL